MHALHTENAADRTDIAIIGAGAAGLMTAIIAGRTARATGGRKNILLLDGARSLGAKILVAGGGRCNVTHETVDETAYSGSTPAAIRKVLRRFDVPKTIEFFREIGVELKCEETGKLFPTTDSAKTVLNGLLNAARDAGATIQFPWRVESVKRMDGAFLIESSDGRVIRAGHVVLATGGKSLPKTGSDGHGYAIVTSLGHTLTKRVFPALVPLTLHESSFVRSLSGVATPVTLEVRRSGGKRLTSRSGSVLCTHFGISGPCTLDISRHYLDARADGDAALFVNWIPGKSSESIDSALLAGGKNGVANLLSRQVPERLARAVCVEADVDPSALCYALTREQR
jgi:predicted Rossmann fold flavoprotein